MGVGKRARHVTGPGLFFFPPLSPPPVLAPPGDRVTLLGMRHLRIHGLRSQTAEEGIPRPKLPSRGVKICHYSVTLPHIF